MAKIEDFGEKIGGARKDLYALHRELRASDIENWTDAEKREYVTKDTCFPKPDYKKLYESGEKPRDVLFFIKRVRDSLPTKPDVNMANGAELYAEHMNWLYENVMKLSVLKDVDAELLSESCESFYHRYFDFVENTEPLFDRSEARKFLKAARIDDRLNFRCFEKDLAKKQFLFSEEEKMLANYSCVKYTGNNLGIEEYGADERLVLSHGSSKWYLYRLDERFLDINNYKPDTYLLFHKSKGLIEINFETNDAAKDHALQIEKQKLKPTDGAKKTSGKKRFVPPQLALVRPTKTDYRHGQNISGEDMLKTFGFRGGEFGNWQTDRDRQANLNMSHDAFKDLASALGIEDMDISLGGKLAIAYGARGRKGAAAHFESVANVINLTKMNGAGSLAHEWGHALDFYIGGNIKMGTETPGKYVKEFDDLVYALRYGVNGRPFGTKSEYYKNAVALDGIHSKHSHGYWQSTAEMFARAFEAYVYDKLEGNSDYLCGHAEPPPFPLDGKAVYYTPQGEERKLINEKFDKLIEKLKAEGLLNKRTEKKEAAEENRRIDTELANGFPAANETFEQLSFFDMMESKSRTPDQHMSASVRSYKKAETHTAAAREQTAEIKSFLKELFILPPAFPVKTDCFSHLPPEELTEFRKVNGEYQAGYTYPNGKIEWAKVEVENGEFSTRINRLTPMQKDALLNMALSGKEHMTLNQTAANNAKKTTAAATQKRRLKL